MTAKQALTTLARLAGFVPIRAHKLDPWHAVSHVLRDRPHPVIFDVGANIGQTAMRCLRVVPAAQIYSFEPSPTTYRALRMTVASLPHVQTFNVAMGEQAGTVTLLENSRGDLSSIFRPTRTVVGEVVRETRVDVSTVDAFCDAHNIDRIDVLKTDTQGFDLAVLRGAKSVLAADAVDIILTELTFSPMYEEEPRFDEVLGYALDHGFRVVALYPWIRDHGFADWADALLVHERLLHITSTASTRPELSKVCWNRINRSHPPAYKFHAS